jgi:Mg2+-importing ATPase
VLRAGVESGRTTFANTLKYVRTTTSANFGNMVSMAIASFYLPFLPLVAGQILLNNFLSDVPQTFVAGDRVDPEVTTRPGRWSVRAIRDFMIVFGLISSAFDILTFVLLRWVDASVDEFRTTWFVESLLTELGIAFVVRTSRPFWKSQPGRALLVSSLVVTAVAIAIPYSPIGPSFALVPLEARWLGLIGIITGAYLASSEIAKRIYVRKHSFDGG